jgi:hypothetical protein
MWICPRSKEACSHYLSADFLLQAAIFREILYSKAIGGGLFLADLEGHVDCL